MPGNDLAIVVPVVNEVGNVQPLIDELHEHLSGYDWEVVFVDDDSSDGTTAALRHSARQDDRVRLVLRINQRGLATATLSGMLTTKARIVVLMDGDSQHDPAVIPRLIAPLTNGDAVRTLPRCNTPVGLGAKRARMVIQRIQWSKCEGATKSRVL
jgi:dolichol-phosphate mannosyltransferase